MNNNVCIDASLALTWLLPQERSNLIDALFTEWDRKGIGLLTAPLFHAEVTSVIREQVYFKKLRPEQGEHIFSIYLQMNVKNIDEPTVYRRAWELAGEFNLPRTYDMQYLAVAELKDCEFWTNDRRLVNSLQSKVPRLKWAGDYSPGKQ
jgi:predicted nucleic acid-binding protein